MTVTVSDMVSFVVPVSDQLAMTVLPCLSSMVAEIVAPDWKITASQFAVVPEKLRLGVTLTAFVVALAITDMLRIMTMTKTRIRSIRFIVSPPFTNKTRERG